MLPWFKHDSTHFRRFLLRVQFDFALYKPWWQAATADSFCKNNKCLNKKVECIDSSNLKGNEMRCNVCTCVLIMFQQQHISLRTSSASEWESCTKTKWKPTGGRIICTKNYSLMTFLVFSNKKTTNCRNLLTASSHNDSSSKNLTRRGSHPWFFVCSHSTTVRTHSTSCNVQFSSSRKLLSVKTFWTTTVHELSAANSRRSQRLAGK